GNIVIKVPATEGLENAPTVVLQGHVDMVCEKNKDKEHDFEKDPITLVRDGEWMRADGTTLGADNAIGVAAGMAVVDDKDVVHGPLEILCTVDEETGLTGVNALESGFISGKYLLNMDSEEDGVFYIGCAGGKDTTGIFSGSVKESKEGYTPYELMITGLKGGHSGLDIHQGRGNAIKLLGRLLERMWDLKFYISEISGGSLRNAIPREAEVTILIKETKEAEALSIIDQFIADSLLELKTTDPGLTVKFEKKNEKVKKVFKRSFAETLIDVILAAPHGVMAMSADIPGLVETSSNLATVSTEKEKVTFVTSQRSSIESAKINTSNSIGSVFALGGGEVVYGDGYPGWQPNMDSDLLKMAKTIHSDLFGKEPEVKAIHAGLETGLLGSKYPGLDMISFGPTITGAHSPTESVNIKDVEKFYLILKRFLADLSKM
ncbi:aminoacyl-histidine dipeptidase, partial [Bacteroidota bacterium]